MEFPLQSKHTANKGDSTIMAITTHSGMKIPGNPIETAASELLRLDKAHRQNVRPRYQNAVNAERFEAAVTIMHAMGFGATESQVKSVVAQATNEELNFEGLAFELIKVQRS